MLGAEAAYCALEAELQHYLDAYKSEYKLLAVPFLRLGAFTMMKEVFNGSQQRMAQGKGPAYEG